MKTSSCGLGTKPRGSHPQDAVDEACYGLGNAISRYFPAVSSCKHCPEVWNMSRKDVTNFEESREAEKSLFRNY